MIDFSALLLIESLRFIEYNKVRSMSTEMEGNMDYLTSAECAKKWNISQRRVAVYCKEGRIDGAILRGRMWLIPSDTEKPIDPRKERKLKNN